MRTKDEILLLDVRQTLTDILVGLRKSNFVSLRVYKGVIRELMIINHKLEIVRSRKNVIVINF